MQMAKMDLNDDQEKTNIETIFWSAMDLLSDDEKKLPQANFPLVLMILDQTLKVTLQASTSEPKCTFVNPVSAHTSAGKTVVALYAIAMSLRNQQRVIYTSPIKALSNQKYREFKEEFSDVGLMTGDVTIEPNASCLVMTTEIWRSMQYKGSEVMREVAWIIFDEVHYMRDRERGVVWEESIVMAPKNSRFVFLSATVPNAKEFADWVAKIHHQPCHIVYTDYRPTPLQHYIFPSGGDGLYLVVDEKGKFREDSFQKALNALVPAKDGNRKRDFGKLQKALLEGKPSEESDIFKLVKMLIQRQYDPVILFSFSKRECEFLAMQMAKMDLNDDQEKLI
ncbi:hypothetical protein KFK09_011066 [Dendrobium nobile]|uniref:Helicase ATP-binding domain-containing protein n=1 Tax=Dendrobium nobile TaxID=94219 RepID=A0A8T3BDG7_DENNO|nr:hypothetical protein KFK09_011066 [Dendrobium nobile]